MRRLSVARLLLAAAIVLPLQLVAQRTRPFTHADTLRGSNGPGRAWWKTTFYDLHVSVNPPDSSITGYNGIVYSVLTSSQEMQIDLQPPLVVDSMLQDAQHVAYRRDGNAFFVSLTKPQRAGDRNEVIVYYHGKPVAARRPPWDGGFIWQHDSLGNRWVSTANEGLGASVWWPNKDLLSEEPDSQRIAITVPDPMVDVSNGRLRSTTHNADGTTTFEWFVTSPINNYSVSVNAGTYAHYTENFSGEAGNLTMDFWPLAYHLDAAHKQFAQARSMMTCFEHWFGPFPWYEDGYKLVEAPHLGMEHQSAVAYGNHYANGYLGRDLSATGHGLKWDFIIVHESAHEWWGNSITDKDAADMWVHESFANYAENLYTECQEGKQAGAEYVIGTRRLVKNDIPIVGHYGVNDEGSGDKYYKGGNMLHTIRQLVDNDEKWRGILRGAQKTFRHQTIMGTQLEEYISKESGVNLSKVFDEYLRTTMIPVFEYKTDGATLSYHWANVVPGFDMPVRVALGSGAYERVKPTEAWQTVKLPSANAAVHVDENFYVDVKNATAPAKP
ncbi:MAG TPA: M1 family metallopeptidase [Gemmatimonadaceae bacterium]|nr:M1 family metallopeptidase [Gemmatimonadaceae bacterium]